MSKKNSSVNLKSQFQNLKILKEVFLNFKVKLDKFNKKKYLIAVSGGPDSLALAALSKAYSYKKKVNFHYVLVDHNLRKGSSLEAEIVKKLLKKNKSILSLSK